MKRLAVVTLFVIASIAIPVAAQNDARYNHCANQASQQSGWNGSSQNPNSKSVARGGVVGAGAGALIGGMGGGNAGRGAAIGAAFGLVAGESRRSNGAQKQQNAENHYYDVLNACLEGY